MPELFHSPPQEFCDQDDGCGLPQPTVPVTAQASRTGKRWAYVLHLEPHEVNFVSQARWGSREAAIAAGEADLAMGAELDALPPGLTP